MNIYLDIDGVLIANEKNPANYAAEFIEYVITNYPDSTYWLTTHCQGDANRPIQDIGELFDEKTVELMRKIKPTTWLKTPAKTEAIDFSKPFLWFDDDLFILERQALMKHGVLENWIVNPRDGSLRCSFFIEFLQSFPIRINEIKL